MECVSYIEDLTKEISVLESVLKEKERDIKLLNKLINQKKETISKCRTNLSQFSQNQIEYRIYSKILNGLSPTKAVEEIAKENYFNNIRPTSANRIWKSNYRNLKKSIKTPLK